MGTSKVSIIITNYKKEKYLHSAIKSCLLQSYKNIEILVVDDASDMTKSLNIVKKLKDRRIRFFYTTKNYGHYACANYAMSKATGKYVTFLGGDDFIAKGHISKLLKFIVKNNLVGTCGMYSRFDLSGRKIKGPVLCEASILFDRKRVINDIGFFHMVRCAADSEYRLRIIRFYGSKKFKVIKQDTYVALFTEDCLTADRGLGLRASARTEYSNRSREFLKNTKKDALFYSYKEKRDPFKFPKYIAVKNFKEKTYKEVLL